MPFVNSEFCFYPPFWMPFISLSCSHFFFFLVWSLQWLFPICVTSRFSCVWFCDCMDHSQPGSSVLGIFLARILERVAMLSSRGSSQPRDWSHISCIAGGFFTAEPRGKPSTMSNQSGSGWHTCIVDLTGNAFSFSLLSKLAVSLSYMAFVMLTCFLYS